MDDFYSDAADFVREMLAPTSDGGLGQGSVSLKRTVTVPGENEWDPPTETVTVWLLEAAVKRVDQRYENGVLIVETVDIVTFAVPNTVPILTDTLIIDGRERTITSLKPTPSAGTVVAWKAVVAV